MKAIYIYAMLNFFMSRGTWALSKKSRASRCIYKAVFLILSLFAMDSFGGCPCFNRYYLYSMFTSEQPHVRCAVITDSYRNEDTRVVVIKSYYQGSDKQPSNYGHASSHSDRCELLIDNQVVLIDYVSYLEKDSCDREIMKTCEGLSQSRWPDGDNEWEPKRVRHTHYDR